MVWQLLLSRARGNRHEHSSIAPTLATAVGIGAALSTTFGGKLVQHFSYRISFLGLGGIAALAFLLLLFALPETKTTGPLDETHSPEVPEGTEA